MPELFHKVLKAFSSMKAGVLLLALLALFSALGSTLLPDSFNHLILFNILIIILFFNLSICTLIDAGESRDYGVRDRHYRGLRQWA